VQPELKPQAGEDIAMQQFTGDMKVADVIRRWPGTAKIFRSRGCPDSDAEPIARIMTVRNAAQRGRRPSPLLEDLNSAVVHAQSHKP